MKINHNGIVCAMSTGNPQPMNNDRGVIAGWSRHSARRNLEFLQSINIPSLVSGRTRRGFCFTLTVGKRIPTPAAFSRMRKRLFHEFRNAGMVCWHWVVEWQRRGAPHLHGIAYYDHDATFTMPAYAATSLMHNLPFTWLNTCRAAELTGAGLKGQDWTETGDVLGWLHYLAKHLSRGVSHYQRNPETLPDEWKQGGCKVWGFGGDWPRSEPVELPANNATRYAMRRWWCKYQLSKLPRKGRKRASGAFIRKWRTYRQGNRDKSPYVGFSGIGPHDVFTTWYGYLTNNHQSPLSCARLVRPFKRPNLP